MLLNDDLSSRALVRAAELEWVPSPAKGVERRLLFRIGGEKARATSIVRYAPGTRFPRHAHPGGEEFLVLEGTFQDEDGDYPEGTYVRNPPGSGHRPGSRTGCTIFVKLWQFSAADRAHIVRLPGEGETMSARPGVVSSQLLFDDASERVSIEQWQAHAEINLDNEAGLELLVVTGAIEAAGETLNRWSWLRLPAGEVMQARVGSSGALIWYKRAPLLHADVCALRAGKPG